MIFPLPLDHSPLAVGTVWSGEESLHYVSKVAEIDQTDRYKLSFRVTGKQDEMWVAYRKSTLVSSRIGDTEIPGAAQDEPAPSKQWLSPAGLLLNEDPLDKSAFPVERLIHFWMPADLPGRWTVNLSTTADQYIGKGRAVFTIGQKASTWRQFDLVYTSPEEPDGLSATGKMWFDLKTGRLLEARIDARNAIPPGGTDKVDLTLTYRDSNATKPR